MPSYTCVVSSNCAAVTTHVSSGSSVTLPASATLPSSFDWRVEHEWTHPTSDAFGTHHMFHAVAALRGVHTARPPAAATLSLPDLAAAHAPLTYTLSDMTSIKTDISLRGPVLTTVAVTPTLCAFWSSLLAEPHGKALTAEKKHDKVGALVVVAILGWTSDNNWIVAHAWGASDCDLNMYGRNGCFIVKPHVLGVGRTCVGVLPAPPVAPTRDHTTTMTVSTLTPQRDARESKQVVKARVTRSHGSNKVERKGVDQLKQNVSAGDIATITLIGVVCAAIAVALCIFLSKRRAAGRKEIKRTKVKTA